MICPTGGIPVMEQPTAIVRTGLGLYFTRISFSPLRVGQVTTLKQENGTKLFRILGNLDNNAAVLLSWAQGPWLDGGVTWPAACDLIGWILFWLEFDFHTDFVSWLVEFGTLPLGFLDYFNPSRVTWAGAGATSSRVLCEPCSRVPRHSSEAFPDHNTFHIVSAFGLELYNFQYGKFPDETK